MKKIRKTGRKREPCTRQCSIKNIAAGIPWHVTAFYPTYKILDRKPTPVKTLRMARDISLEEGLRFVYEGNIPGKGGENTYSPSCGAELITRSDFSIRQNRLTNGGCSDCGERIEGRWDSP